MRMKGDVQKLSIRGRIIGPVTALSSVCDIHQSILDSTPPLIQCTEQMCRWIDEAEEFITTHSKDLYEANYASQEAHEILWRVLSGDRTQTAFPAEQLHGRHFQSFRSSLREFQSLSRQYRGNQAGLMQAIKDHGPFGDVTSPRKVGEMLRDLIGSDLLFASKSYPRRMAATNMGYIGMVPRRTELEDLIVLIHGSQVPFVLRSSFAPTHSEAEYQLVGECYLHGAMNGEMLRADDTEKDFVIF